MNRRAYRMDQIKWGHTVKRKRFSLREPLDSVQLGEIIFPSKFQNRQILYKFPFKHSLLIFFKLSFVSVILLARKKYQGYTSISKTQKAFHSKISCCAVVKRSFQPHHAAQSEHTNKIPKQKYIEIHRGTRINDIDLQRKMKDLFLS